MTHLEMLRAMLAQFAGRFNESECELEDGTKGVVIAVKNSDGSNAGAGYIGFFSEWTFDGTGSLIEVAHYE